MSLIVNPGYALRFNGISDSVLVPVSNNAFHGKTSKERKRLPAELTSFTIETWFTPDCGGILFEQDNVMRLTAGTPSAPGPATFEVRLMNPASGRSTIVSLSSAKPVYRANGVLAYWDGILLPTPGHSVHDSYRSTDSTKSDTTAFNEGHRELINLSVIFNRRELAMYINGDLVARQTFDEDYELMPQQNHIYIGGKGGEYRGIIEAVHWSRGNKLSGTKQYGPIKSSQTLGLWRFEEPISPISTVVTTTASASASTGTSSILTVSTSDALTLAKELSGNASVSGTLSLNTAPYSQGNYSFKKYSATSSSTVTANKVPFNLIINPRGYDANTGKPTNKAPERVRLLSINTSNGQLTVESIHRDFTNTNGNRGLLMTHAAGSEIVVVTGDCIVDQGNNNEFQPQGAGTQFSQRQGQICIDESDYGNHGIVFSLSMAIDTHEFNTFSATSSNPGKNYLTGHTGRHIYNHVTSHPLMGILPEASSHVVEKKLDASADVISATFPAMHSDIRNIAPPNSIVSSYDTTGPIVINNFTNQTVANFVIENGMADIDDSKRKILAIGGVNFNPDLFLLKSLSGHNEDNIRAIIPSTESRIAILRLPELSQYNYAPFIQVHYNAVDRRGDMFSTKAASRLTKDGTSTVLTLESVKCFGRDGLKIPASGVLINGVPASTTVGVTATINYANKTLTFSAATSGAFQALDTDGAIVRVQVLNPKIMVEKTLPDVNTVLGGSYRIIDLIHDTMAVGGLQIYSPGGIISFDKPELFPYKDGELEGQDSEGLVVEEQLDFSLCPENYLPLSSSDPPQNTPQPIEVVQTELTSRSSEFNKIIIKQTSDTTGAFEETGNISRRKATNGTRIKTGVFINQGTGTPDGYAASTTSAMAVDGQDATDLFSTGDVIYRADGAEIGTLTAVTSTALTVGAGTAVAVVNNAEIYSTGQILGKGSTNQSTAVNEVFDIIEHKSSRGTVQLIVQPTDRRKFTQLSKLNTNAENPNKFTIEYLSTKARVLSFNQDSQNNYNMLAYGLVNDIASSSVNVKGAASSDSHIVKEIMPGAPVVSVTLGGPGQGAVNTKETWDPSPIARLAWSTRRDCAVKVTAITTGSAHATLASKTNHSITVEPLRNNATDLGSWGTYCFPSQGKVYLESGASAEYQYKTSTKFEFDANTQSVPDNRFSLGPTDTSINTFADWVTATGLRVGDILYVDDKFTEESMCEDGTTINDRMFQSMSNVQHDYQLGSQYSSTRALVEIPLFDDFFFDNIEDGIFPGPDNSMKIHLDATHTAHTWNPNPVGRRFDATEPIDTEARSHFQASIRERTYTAGSVITQPIDLDNRKLYVEDGNQFPKPTTTHEPVAGIDGSTRYRRAFLPNGEWVIYTAINTSTAGAHYLTIAGSASAMPVYFMSKGFAEGAKPGVSINVGSGYPNLDKDTLSDNPYYDSAGYEGRRSFYYDRANVQTQGGNVDYGLRQYVSAIEFRAGPRVNPHLPRVQNKRPTATVVATTGSSPVTALVLDDASLFPDVRNKHYSKGYRYRIMWENAAGSRYCSHYDTITGDSITLSNPETFAGVADNAFNPAVGDKITLIDLHRPAAVNSNSPRIYPNQDNDVILNKAWANPYCPGGLRHGDTIWMNMHYSNPHAIEGLFCKSRGVLNEGLVLREFNGGKDSYAAEPRDAGAMENFLIGNTCIETAQNFVQHVNKTIEINRNAMNCRNLGFVPVVAFLDPYQSSEDFARVLLYDINQDREFIAFQDIWMQVQTSPDVPLIGKKQDPSDGVIVNGSREFGSRIDVPAGYPSQDRYMNAAEESDFIEGAYAHNSDYNSNNSNGHTTHTPDIGDIASGLGLPRTNDATITDASVHAEMTTVSTNVQVEKSTMFDTPDGTRVIPAFLALKGIRNKSNDISFTATSGINFVLSQLPHWTYMDFTRRLTIDLGEVAAKIGGTNILAAAKEVVRLINQAGAKNGKTHARRPADQYLGETRRFDLSSPGPKGGGFSSDTDPSASHMHADFATTGSTHDPSPFWNDNLAFSTHDRGTHMGYMRAHLGRTVTDANGKSGYSIIVHSTVPGAQGRNFCAWLDASRAQSKYQPEFLIGHGGRFRNYFCQPDEMSGENMHPAPMPINRFGRPFAPITTLHEYLPPELPTDQATNSNSFGKDTALTGTTLADSDAEHLSGRSQNTVASESMEKKSPGNALVKGLRVGTQAKARINFGGLTQAGIPGWAPDTGKWGFGDGSSVASTKFAHIYSNTARASETVSTNTSSTSTGYIPEADTKSKNVGNGALYGIRLVDHRGGSHTVRMVYRKFGGFFSNDNTRLPATLEKEMLIHFDDRDVGQGGFTIGRHMLGKGDCTGRLSPASTASNLKAFKGNKWNNYPSRDVGIKVTTVKDTSALTLTVTLAAPYDTGSTLSHSDILGYLGFPESGLIQFSKNGNATQGVTVSYESRSKSDKSGAHVFYGVRGLSSDLADASDWLMSPRINFTSLLTDEVIAAAVDYAINLGVVDQDDEELTSFDCTHMFAPDGKTLGEWGVLPGAIRFRIPTDRDYVPLSAMFSSKVSPDWGLQVGAASAATISGHHTGGLTTTEQKTTALDLGYIPKTVLQLTTKFRGTNANTATPLVVDSQNNPIDITTWKSNLDGTNFIDVAGDKIIPRVDSPAIVIDALANSTVTTGSGFYTYLVAAPGSDSTTGSWGEQVTLWYGSENFVVMTSDNSGSDAETKLNYSPNDVTKAIMSKDLTLFKNSNVVTLGDQSNFSNSQFAQNDVLIKNGGPVHKASKIDGVRRAGSAGSQPLLYFRGARDSPDHWVPLYFGGGFSGNVMDINDGTENDYGDFYEHPYAVGPTGSCGFQNVGEITGSHAMIDTNALLAMFPGTPYLDQHKGLNHPPFFNQDAILTFDMAMGANTKDTGITYTDGTNTVKKNIPSPVVLRFAHPHARYSATGDTSNHTTYMIFGPGQSFPHNSNLTSEDKLSNTITLGNGYSGVPIFYNTVVSVAGRTAGDSSNGYTYLPNEIANGNNDRSNSGLAAVSLISAHLPKTDFYQKNNLSGYNYLMNWEPTKGFPNNKSDQSDNRGYYNDFNQAAHYDGPKGLSPSSLSSTINASNSTLNRHAHPYAMNIASNVASSTPIVGTTTIPKSRVSTAIWQMDGGYHPGGHFLDNHIIMNPNAAEAATPIAQKNKAWEALSHFRPCGLLGKAYSTYFTGGSAAANERAAADYDFVLVDATRVQNAEELGTVLSAAINTYPGSDPLKAIGGTFMPSMQSAHGQDRYGWVDLTISAGTNHNGTTADATITAAADGRIANLPSYGWLRFSDGTNSYFAPYHSLNKSSRVFTLGRNPLLQDNGGGVFNVITTNPVNPINATQILPADMVPAVANPDFKMYVWTKSGVRVGHTLAANDQWAHVHFNGLHDAVDRTRPTGAVGWNGLPYAKINTYAYDGDEDGRVSGLGSWHSFLGFSPYGAAESCISTTQPVNNDEAAITFNKGDHCINGLSHRHIVVVTHESELPLIAKADRHGIFCSGDWMYASSIGEGDVDGSKLGTTPWDVSKVHNKSRYVGPATAGPHVEAQVHSDYKSPIGANVGASYDDYPATGSLAAVVDGEHQWHPTFTSGKMVRMDSCLYPTGDLFWDESVMKNSNFHDDFSATYGTGNAVECIGISGLDDYLAPNTGRTYENANDGLFAFYHNRSAARNFLPEHVVWKRMDGGSLTMPAVNARGLGMIPWTMRALMANKSLASGDRVHGAAESQWHMTGEKILGNVRFSFETTNSAMFPIIQAQELSHPQLAEQNNIELKEYVLQIPNEEEQFKSQIVIDDTGQQHLIKGGSPLGTVIREFGHVDDDSRDAAGMAPAIAGQGDAPNLKIRLPNPDEIPGNIIVRSGFDRIQAYQNETMGSGGMAPLHGTNNVSKYATLVKNLFQDTYPGPFNFPSWENKGWEHISQDGADVFLKYVNGQGGDRLKFPASTNEGFNDNTAGAPLETNYELHDRSLYFHVTKMGTTGTNAHVSSVIISRSTDAGTRADPATIEIEGIAEGNQIVTNHFFLHSDDYVTDVSGVAPTGARRFARIFDSNTGRGGVFSYTGMTGMRFDGVVYTPQLKTMLDELEEGMLNLLSVSPSYYMPAGTTRHFASRRLRDHSEYSGASPDMKKIDWFGMYNSAKPSGSGSFANPSVPYQYLTAPKMTPMPIPRMGHHYVTPTMALLPGHYAHPAYQRIFDLNTACKASSHAEVNSSLIGAMQSKRENGAETTAATGTNYSLKDYYNPLIWFSTPSAPFAPSDIHGGAFTLMTETKLKYEGYGVAAGLSKNAEGGHSIVLEAASSYTMNNHFPDPMEVGAYQIIIQPNLYNKQLSGSHENATSATAAPSEATTGSAKTLELTSQQVNTVIAIEQNPSTYGGYTLILAEATMADVRGCEIIINEIMLDIEPDAGSQFTNLPPLALYNPLGVQETTSPQFSRRSLPYRPGMFSSSTPGRVLTTTWWSQTHVYGVDTGPVAHNKDGGSGTYGLTISTAGSSYTGASGLATTSTNGHGTGMTVTITVGGSGELTSVVVVNPGSGYRIGEIVSVTQSSNTTARLTVSRINSTGWRHLEWTKPDNYYEFCRAGFGSIGAQLTLAGYPTHFLDIYEPHKRRRSLNPVCQVISSSSGSGTITVDDNTMFPMIPYYGEKLEIISNTTEERLTGTYTGRKGGLSKPSDGTSRTATLGQHIQFTGVTGDTKFWAGLAAGTNIRLTRPYDTNPSDSVYTDSLTSITTRILPQIYDGSRDTNSLHLPDAFLCMWHPNLGRPFTWYSDTATGGTRAAYAGTGTADVPVDAKGYNHVPEHFETIHYHDFNYVASKGPFALSMKAVVPAHYASFTGVNGEINLQNASNLLSSGSLVDNGSGYAKQTTGGIVVDTTDPQLTLAVGMDIYKSNGEKIGKIAAFTEAYAAGTANHATFTVVSHGTGTLVALANNDEICYKRVDPANLYTAAEIDGAVDMNPITGSNQFIKGLVAQGGSSGSARHHYINFWPGGSRGGPAVSRLESYGHALIGWGSDTYGLDCESFDDSTGVRERTYAQMTSASPYARNFCFGYRFGIRQAYNRPQWAPYVRGWQEVADGQALLGYYHGPLVQQEAGTWNWVGTASGQANSSVTTEVVGILERITQVSSLLNQDQIGRQVRYSDGRRMTRSFGCPVRTLRNDSAVRRQYPNDVAGKGIVDMAEAHRYYMVDWWGNTRGEDVRRFPVRGFGVRPSWDPADAYKDTNYTHLPSTNNLFGGAGNDTQSGNDNSENEDQVTVTDWFNPASMLRVGDRGDGRGCRWPTVFNESLLMSIDEAHDATGLVLSGNTAEPTIGQGLVRPTNSVLAEGEIERGLSDRVDLNDDTGLLRISASVGENIESITADTKLVEPISRKDIIMGLDVDTLAELNDGVSREYVVMSTEAHSLHTDTEVGQRTNIRGAYDVGSRTLKDLDMTSLTFAGNPIVGVIKHSNAHALWSLGGSYYVTWARNAGVLDTKGWGQPKLPSSGLVLWLRADGLSLDNGAAVTEWRDESGEGHVFTQGTASAQPSYVSSDSDFNNKPHVHFDGGDYLDLAFDATLNTNQVTMFVVSTVDSDTGAKQTIIENTNGNTGWLLYANMSASPVANSWQLDSGTGSALTTQSSSASAVVANTPSIATFTLSGGDGAGASATKTFHINGVQANQTTAGYTKKASGTQRIGANSSAGLALTGQVAEIIQYNRALTDAEREMVESYLSQKYNIAVTTNNKSYRSTHPNHVLDSNLTSPGDPIKQNINTTRSSVNLIYRPVQVLDSQHSLMFRGTSLVSKGPQANNNYFKATAGGKYGLFYSSASSTGNRSVFAMYPSHSTTVPVSQGPKIPGVDVSGYDKTDITNPVAHMVMTANTLQHFRADASRKSVDDEQGNFSVQARFSQALHPKGNDNVTKFNDGNHN